MANVNTTGFKKSRAEFQDLLYQTIRSPGGQSGNGASLPSGIQVGLGVRTVATQALHVQGAMKQTGNSLDVAIEGNGFFQVAMPNGQTVYSRDGAFKVSSEGRLVTTDGFPLTTDIVLPPDAINVKIGQDGVVMSTSANQESAPVELGRIELATFVNPAGLVASGRNLFRATAASGQPITGNPGENGIGSLSQGTLELSNVKVVEEMIDLISGQRAYEVNARVIKAADEMLGQTANLR
jgi:flagellar basal-body rod protein FlgG